jgi:hypothetical protein
MSIDSTGVYGVVNKFPAVFLFNVCGYKFPKFWTKMKI